MAIFTESKLSFGKSQSQNAFTTKPNNRLPIEPQSQPKETPSSCPGLNDPSLLSAWPQYAWIAIGFAAVLATLARSAAGVGSSAHWLEPALAGLAGYLAADLATGLYHWVIDNYSDASTPVLGPHIEVFTRHHDRPRAIARLRFVDLVHVPARTTALVLPPVALLCGNRPAALAFLGVFFGFALLSLRVHAWAHAAEAELPPLVAALQGVGLLVSPRHHAAHHRPLHATHYCILSGIWNAFLDGTMLFRALETAVFAVLGVRPRSWGMFND